MGGKKYKILVAEDDPSLNSALSEGLTNGGYESILAITGNEALRKLKTENPDLVLLDIMLPDISGMEVLANMRANDSLKDIPVLLLTVLSDSDTIQKGVALGIRGYLVKTDYTIEEILDKIKEILK